MKSLAVPWVDQERLAWHAERMVQTVQRALRSPAQRAALRRCVGRPPEHVTARTAHALVAPFLPENADRATEWAFYSVAALIAAQAREARDETGPGTPGDSEEAAGTTDLPLGQPNGESPAAEARRRANLGAALAAAVLSGKGPAEQTVESRLHLLCRQDLSGLHRHLARTVGHLRRELVPVDWVGLTVDLARWGSERDQVAKGWLQSFYRALAKARSNTDKPGSADGGHPGSESEDQ